MDIAKMLLVIVSGCHIKWENVKLRQHILPLSSPTVTKTMLIQD